MTSTIDLILNFKKKILISNLINVKYSNISINKNFNKFSSTKNANKRQMLTNNTNGRFSKKLFAERKKILSDYHYLHGKYTIFWIICICAYSIYLYRVIIAMVKPCWLKKVGRHRSYENLSCSNCFVWILTCKSKI